MSSAHSRVGSLSIGQGVQANATLVAIASGVFAAGTITTRKANPKTAHTTALRLIRRPLRGVGMGERDGRRYSELPIQRRTGHASPIILWHRRQRGTVSTASQIVDYRLLDEVLCEPGAP